MLSTCLIFAIFLLLFSGLASPAPVQTPQSPKDSNGGACRCFPGDSCWPSFSDWVTFNRTLGGKLIATQPIASVCHVDTFKPYNLQQCNQLQSVWSLAQTHVESSSSIMAPFFANNSCDPFAPKETPCVIGSYVQYAVNASTASDYQHTIEFAKGRNIRLTIRNTGHDYLGKATGAGALALWTHNIKQIDIIDHKSTYYSGKAIKVGAGVSVIEAYQAAHAKALVVVGGNDRTVGFAGGYTQGGGHGQLVSRFGLAADQVLEWEVVTGDGDLIVASPTQNADLYWALCGGGGGTYAAVLSMTSKAHPDERTAAANLTFSNTGVSQDAFYEVVETFINTLPDIVDAGAVSVWLLTNTSFTMTPTSALGLPKAGLDKLLQPTIAKLKQNKLNYTYFVEDFPTFLDAFEPMSPPTPVDDIQIGGRFIQRSLIESTNGTRQLMVALRDIANKVGAISGIALDASRKSGYLANSANPAWRETIFDAVVGTYWSDNSSELNIANQRLVTDDVIPQLERLTPGGGAYLSEGDFKQPNWQTVFYGDNYSKLRSIKKKYDPRDVFYALTAVGSESWTVKQDGRLCIIT